MIQPGLYRHYKGNLYEVIGMARHSETLEELVVYKATDQPEGENIWVRPATMFSETVILDGMQRQRFEKIA
ncbi:MAG: DUF1653 domain-containing protein [Bacteroidia bacterium]|nr:DUF1653 domain-containing protein [Bacteroidia bacterium]